MSKKLFVKIMIVEGIVASLALVFIFVAIWNKPLGPVLGLPAPTPQKIAGLSNPSGVAPEGSMSIADPTPTPESLLSQIVSKLIKPNSSSGAFCDAQP
jgi:hypothetical protein